MIKLIEIEMLLDSKLFSIKNNLEDIKADISDIKNNLKSIDEILDRIEMYEILL